MDITVNELKIMKSKQLRRLVREVIEEILKENTAMVTSRSGTKAVSFNNPTELNSLKSDSNVTSITTTSGQKIKEMARIAKGFRLANPQFDDTPYQNKRVSGTSLADVINFLSSSSSGEPV